jgi:hypothetical protein
VLLRRSGFFPLYTCHASIEKFRCCASGCQAGSGSPKYRPGNRCVLGRNDRGQVCLGNRDICLTTRCEIALSTRQPFTVPLRLLSSCSLRPVVRGAAKLLCRASYLFPENSLLGTVSPAHTRTPIRNYAEPGGKFSRTKPHLNIGIDIPYEFSSGERRL